ncbi:MAG: hypothetical protein WCK65_15880 [Rhodospirillaceae bacterium]
MTSEVTMETAAAFAANIAVEAGDAMEAAFSSARSGDRDGAMEMAREAVTKALLAKKALATVLHAQTSAATQLQSRVALGHVEDARLFAKAAMDVSRSFARRISDKGGGEAGKKSAETLAYLMAAASTLLEIKRGGFADNAVRKVAMAAERAGMMAEEAIKLGGPHADDAKASKETASEIARRALYAARETLK